MFMTEETQQVNPAEDDDSFMDWETRKETIPFGKHVIAGKSLTPTNFIYFYH